jgi:hypothetical protein
VTNSQNCRVGAQFCLVTWPTLKIFLTWKIWKHVLSHLKARAFRYQKSENTCLRNGFCTGIGRRTPALKFIKNSYGVVAPAVEGLGRILLDRSLCSSMRTHRTWSHKSFATAVCVLILLYMCPIVCGHIAITQELYTAASLLLHVSSYYCVCVLILLCICPHTTMCVLTLLYMCPHTTMYVSAYYDTVRRVRVGV